MKDNTNANLVAALGNARAEIADLERQVSEAQARAEFWRVSWESIVDDVGALVRSGVSVTPAELGALLKAQENKPPQETDL